MKNIRKILRPAAALLLSLAAAGAMAGSQSVSVSIIGPGGHSNGDYGNVNAVHAAARSIMLIEKSVPDAVVTAVTGGNSVNSIAAYANFRVLLEGDVSIAVNAYGRVSDDGKQNAPAGAL